MRIKVPEDNRVFVELKGKESSIEGPRALSWLVGLVVDIKKLDLWSSFYYIYYLNV